MHSSISISRGMHERKSRSWFGTCASYNDLSARVVVVVVVVEKNEKNGIKQFETVKKKICQSHAWGSEFELENGGQKDKIKIIYCSFRSRYCGKLGNITYYTPPATLSATASGRYLRTQHIHTRYKTGFLPKKVFFHLRQKSPLDHNNLSTHVNHCFLNKTHITAVVLVFFFRAAEDPSQLPHPRSDLFVPYFFQLSLSLFVKQIHPGSRCSGGHLSPLSPMMVHDLRFYPGKQ